MLGLVLPVFVSVKGPAPCSTSPAVAFNAAPPACVTAPPAFSPMRIALTPWSRVSVPPVVTRTLSVEEWRPETPPTAFTVSAFGPLTNENAPLVCPASVPTSLASPSAAEPDETTARSAAVITPAVWVAAPFVAPRTTVPAPALTSALRVRSFSARKLSGNVPVAPWGAKAALTVTSPTPALLPDWKVRALPDARGLVTPASIVMSPFSAPVDPLSTTTSPVFKAVTMSAVFRKAPVAVAVNVVVVPDTEAVTPLVAAVDPTVRSNDGTRRSSSGSSRRLR